MINDRQKKYAIYWIVRADIEGDSEDSVKMAMNKLRGVEIKEFALRMSTSRHKGQALKAKECLDHLDEIPSLTGYEKADTLLEFLQLDRFIRDSGALSCESLINLE